MSRQQQPPSEQALLGLVIDYLSDLSKAPKHLLRSTGIDDNNLKLAVDNLKLATDYTNIGGYHRYYRLNGLAGTVQTDEGAIYNRQSEEEVDEHVSLAEAVFTGMNVLNARSRVDAEEEIEHTPLFKEFLSAVKSRGYFASDKSETYETKYNKVLTKFRLKLRDKAIADPNNPAAFNGSSIRGINDAAQRIKLRTLLNRQELEVMDEAEAHKGQGNKNMQRKDYQSAVECYTLAIDILAQVGKPTHRDVMSNKSVYFCNRSAAYLSLNQYELAVDDARNSITLNGEYGKAYFRLGLALYFQRQYEDALESFMSAQTYGEDNAATNQYVKKVMDLIKGNQQQTQSSPTMNKKQQQSQNISSKQSDFSPVDKNKKAETLKMQGNNLMSQKKFEKAIESYTKAIDLVSNENPNLYIYYSNRAAALCFLQDYEAAADDATASINLKADYGKAHARLGLSLFFLGHYEDAVEAYRTALRYEPDNKASLSYLQKAEAKFEETRGR